MDIASRIKLFKDTLGIANSQFADTCGIPRPTFSQILNGRNKKISDEIIGKIHEAYPQLSVLWLMFGEGQMLNDANIPISEPQISGTTGDSYALEDETEWFSNDQSNIPSISDNVSDNFQAKNEEFTPPRYPNHNAQRQEVVEEIATSKTNSPRAADMSINIDTSRRIVNIMVLYSDNSVEWFVPKPH